EGLTGDRPAETTQDLAQEPNAAGFRWRQKFTGLSGAVWVHVSDQDVSAIGAAILRAAEVEETDPAKLKAEFLEIVRQSLASAARALSARLERESVCESGAESTEASRGAWTAVEIKSADWAATVSIAIDPDLCAALDPPEPAPKSKNYDLLLD